MLPINKMNIDTSIGITKSETKNINSESIKVLVRVRPLSSQDNVSLSTESVIDIIGPSSLSVATSDSKRSFQCSFDSVLGPQSSQLDVYQTVRECTVSVLQGFNSTIFAYGQVTVVQ